MSEKQPSSAKAAEGKLCAVCAKNPVMGGKSSAAKTAQQLSLCSPCYATKGMTRKRREELGLPMRAARGAGPQAGRATRARKPKSGPNGRGLNRGSTRLAAHLNAYADALDGVATVLDDSGDRIEQDLHAVEDAFAAAGKGLGDACEHVKASQDNLHRATRRLLDVLPQAPPERSPKPERADIKVPGFPKEENTG